MHAILLAAILSAPVPETPDKLPKGVIQSLRRTVDSVVHVRILRGEVVERTQSGAVVSSTRAAEFVVTALPAGTPHPDEGAAFEVVRKDFEVVAAEWVGLDDRTRIALLRIPSGGVKPLSPARGLGLRPRARVYLVTNPLGIQANIERAFARDIELLPPGDTISCMRLGYECPCRGIAAGGILADERGRAIALVCGPPEGSQRGAHLAARGGAPDPPEPPVRPGAAEALFDLAIPMEVVVRICGALVKTGEVRRGQVGATFGWPSDEQRVEYGSDTTGIVVVDVRPGGPAACAGLLPGDLVTAAGGVEIRTVRDALTIAERVEFELVGGSLTVDVLRLSSIGAGPATRLPRITIAVEPLPSLSVPPRGAAPR